MFHFLYLAYSFIPKYKRKNSDDRFDRVRWSIDQLFIKWSMLIDWSVFLSYRDRDQSITKWWSNGNSGNHWADTKKELGFSWSSCKIGYSSCFHRKYPKIVKNRKIDGPYQRNFFWAVSWVLFKIHQFHLKFDGDHESVSFFYHSSIVEELSVYFRTIWVF
jgi:hypothetical protein